MKLYSQLDPKWKNQKLGTSSVSIGGYGCLVSVMAMLACYYGKDETPETLDTWLIQNKGYQSRNLYKWFEGLTKKYPDIKCEGLFGVPYPLNKTQEAEIDNELSNNRPVVVQVDYNPMTAVLDGHWCLIVDKKNGVYQIADPLEYPAKIVPITKYGKQATTINYFVEHSGSLPNNMYESKDLQECLKQHSKLVDECIAKESKIKELEKTVSGQAGELLKKNKAILLLERQLEAEKLTVEDLDKLREKWHKLYSQANGNLTTSGKENIILKGKITRIESTSFETASKKILIAEIFCRYLGVKNPLVEQMLKGKKKVGE